MLVGTRKGGAEMRRIDFGLHHSNKEKEKEASPITITVPGGLSSVRASI